MIIAALCMLPFRYGVLDHYDIEVEAKKLGMIYPGSNRAIAPEEKTSESALNDKQDEEN